MVPGDRWVSSTCELNVPDNRPTWGRGEGVGGTKHGTTGLDGVQTLPDHRDDGAGGHILDQAGEEGFLLQILVV